MKIYLIGFMGCGKSTIGKLLARKLKLRFIDLDALIQERTYSTIPELFEKKGEAGFREQEKLALHQAIEMPDSVIATGGGAPCFFDNMERMNADGKTVYLKLSPTELAKRLANSKTVRPLIAGKSGEELETFIAEKLAERESWYSQAQFTVAPSRNEVDELAELLAG